MTLGTQTSANVDASYRREFSAAQTGTPSSAPVAGDAEFRTTVIRALASSRDFGRYDSVIVNFYEEIIQRLQREVARYKSMMGVTPVNIESEPEPNYVLSVPVPQAESVKSKLLTITGNYLQAPDLDL